MTNITPLTALLYEHEDGRYAVNPDTTGDPGWHRLGPVDLGALAAQAGAPAAPAALICAAHAVVDADDAQALTQKHIEVLRAAAVAAEKATAAAVAGPSAPTLERLREWEKRGELVERVWGTLVEQENEIKRLTAAPATQAEPVAVPHLSDAQIKAVFLANGFTIKDGQTDLKPYVYRAAHALLAAAPTTQAEPAGGAALSDDPTGWRNKFAYAVYADLAAADNQDVPLEEYPARILKVLDSIVGPRHPAVIHWRNDAIQACIAIAYKYCRDPESFQYLKQDLQALIAAAPAQPAEGVPAATAGEVVYRWHALDHSGYCYGSNPPDDLPARCNLMAFYRQPDAYHAALHEISATGNLTATGQQFARLLQQIARNALAAAPLAPAAPAVDALAERDAAFEAVRNWLCGLQRYSFVLDDDGVVRRTHDRTGNWIEFDAAHELFDPVAVDAALAAQAAAKGAA